MKKIQKRPARVTRCKRGSSKIHKKPDTRSVDAIRMANTRAQKAAHKKKKQVTNIRTRAKKALQQERPYTPKTADTKLKKIVADMHRSITKRVDNADRKSDNAMSEPRSNSGTSRLVRTMVADVLAWQEHNGVQRIPNKHADSCYDDSEERNLGNRFAKVLLRRDKSLGSAPSRVQLSPSEVALVNSVSGVPRIHTPL